MYFKSWCYAEFFPKFASLFQQKHQHIWRAAISKVSRKPWWGYVPDGGADEEVVRNEQSNSLYVKCFTLCPPLGHLIYQSRCLGIERFYLVVSLSLMCSWSLLDNILI